MFVLTALSAKVRSLGWGDGWRTGAPRAPPLEPTGRPRGHAPKMTAAAHGVDAIISVFVTERRLLENRSDYPREYAPLRHRHDRLQVCMYMLRSMGSLPLRRVAAFIELDDPFAD
eukprot:609274-Prymnesium_polylepis.1